jgi:aminopeptidase N
MATYVAALAIGPLTLVESEGPHGIHIRHAFAPSLAAVGEPAFANTAQMIADLESMFGPYPDDSYGALVVDGILGYAMENQTLSLFDRSIVDGSFDSSKTMVHELAHHWFGNWVSPATWQDTWLNEGFATYAEQLWLEHTIAGYDIDGAMREMARRPLGPIGDPGADDLFSAAVYVRGALTVHALRKTMGDAAFFRLLRAWCDRYGGSAASTEDLADLASEVGGTDLHPLVDAWVNNPAMPALPN